MAKRCNYEEFGTNWRNNLPLTQFNTANPDKIIAPQTVKKFPVLHGPEGSSKRPQKPATCL